MKKSITIRIRNDRRAALLAAALARISVNEAEKTQRAAAERYGWERPLPWANGSDVPEDLTAELRELIKSYRDTLCPAPKPPQTKTPNENRLE